MWFQTETLARATVGSLVEARYADKSDAGLYNDQNYVSLLGGFGQNMLIPTGSRAAKRAKSGSDMFDPRQLRAIPHNAILQQFGSPANIFYGVGRAAAIDPEKFITH